MLKCIINEMFKFNFCTGFMFKFVGNHYKSFQAPVISYPPFTKTM